MACYVSHARWGIGPLLKVVEAYKARLPPPPNPPAANITRFLQRYRMELGQEMHPRRHVDTTDGGVFPVWDTADDSVAASRNAQGYQCRQP